MCSVMKAYTVAEDYNTDGIELDGEQVPLLKFERIGRSGGERFLVSEELATQGQSWQITRASLATGDKKTYYFEPEKPDDTQRAIVYVEKFGQWSIGMAGNGIERLAGDASLRGRCLLLLSPGASFEIHRDRDEYAKPIVTITWDGETLRREERARPRPDRLDYV